MEYIRVTKENLEKEHICCAISNNKDIQVSSKKAWLADRFDEGLVFLKSAAMFFIIQTNVLLMQSMYQSWKKPLRRMVFHSKL